MLKDVRFNKKSSGNCDGNINYGVEHNHNPLLDKNKHHDKK